MREASGKCTLRETCRLGFRKTISRQTKTDAPGRLVPGRPWLISNGVQSMSMPEGADIFFQEGKQFFHDRLRLLCQSIMGRRSEICRASPVVQIERMGDSFQYLFYFRDLSFVSIGVEGIFCSPFRWLYHNTAFLKKEIHLSLPL